MTSQEPEDPLVAKERKKLYEIGKKYQRKPVNDDQLVMFDPEVIHFRPWRTKFEKLLETREIEDEETKKAILLKALLAKTVQLIPTFFRRYEEPMEKDTEVILNKLQDHYEKIERKHRIKARIRFFGTTQGERSFYEFANALKDQLFDCDFGSFEEDALVLVFVQGLSNPVLKKHLLEKELWLTSLLEAVELAIKFQDVLPNFTREGSSVSGSVWDSTETLRMPSELPALTRDREPTESRRTPSLLRSNYHFE